MALAGGLALASRVPAETSPPAPEAACRVSRSRSCQRQSIQRAIPTLTCSRSGSRIRRPAARPPSPIRCPRCSQRLAKEVKGAATGAVPRRPRPAQPVQPHHRPADRNSARRSCRRCSRCKPMPRTGNRPPRKAAIPAIQATPAARPSRRSKARAIIIITAVAAGSRAFFKCWIHRPAARPPRPRPTATAPRPPPSTSATGRAFR